MSFEDRETELKSLILKAVEKRTCLSAQFPEKRIDYFKCANNLRTLRRELRRIQMQRFDFEREQQHRADQHLLNYVKQVREEVRTDEEMRVLRMSRGFKAPKPVITPGESCAASAPVAIELPAYVSTYINPRQKHGNPKLPALIDLESHRVASGSLVEEATYVEGKRQGKAVWKNLVTGGVIKVHYQDDKVVKLEGHISCGNKGCSNPKPITRTVLKGGGFKDETRPLCEKCRPKGLYECSCYSCKNY
jgi:hypothetical protein